ncbi:MAG: hypothetical protein D6710_01900 [Nitrospirae bacterium]|nr:MAG: hypothetical protein D6710_01900 [Nitrospirota bacterium]
MTLAVIEGFEAFKPYVDNNGFGSTDQEALYEAFLAQVFYDVGSDISSSSSPVPFISGRYGGVALVTQSTTSNVNLTFRPFETHNEATVGFAIKINDVQSPSSFSYLFCPVYIDSDGFVWRNNSIPGTTANDGVITLEITSNSPYTWDLDLVRGSSTIDSTLARFPVGGWWYIEFNYKLGTAGVADGHYNLRVNNQLVLSQTGVQMLDSGFAGVESSFNSIEFKNVRDFYGIGGIDDIYVNTANGPGPNFTGEFLGDCVVEGTVVAGSGVPMQWTRANVASNWHAHTGAYEPDNGLATGSVGSTGYVYTSVVGREDYYSLSGLSVITGDALGMSIGITARNTVSTETGQIAVREKDPVAGLSGEATPFSLVAQNGAATTSYQTYYTILSGSLVDGSTINNSIITGHTFGFVKKA